MDQYISYVNVRTTSITKTVFNAIVFLSNYPRTLFCQLLYLLSHNKQLILSDVGTYSNLIKTLIFRKHYRNLFYHRIGRISELFSWLLPGESSIVLHYSCKIGAHAHFIHNIGCHLNAKSIGRDFKCYQHVVLGAKALLDSGLPSIGDNVTLATGAVIVGNVTIGNNVQICANSFVNRSVPDNCVVLGNPAYIVKKDGEKITLPLV